MNLELFGCAGGMAEGFRRAGIAFDLAIDRDPDACASYEANLGVHPVQMDARDLLRMIEAGWRADVGLVVADPPCTPWSTAGKRLGRADPRDMLATTCEVIRRLGPPTWLVANVPGLETRPAAAARAATLGALARAGWCVDHALLDAANVGVPQHRRRPFWFGHRGGPCLRWPAPTHAAPAACAAPRLPGFEAPRSWVTVREALAHLAPAELGRPARLRRRGCHGRQPDSMPDAPAKVVGTSNLSGGNVLVVGVSRKHRANRPDEPSQTVCARSARSAVGAAILEWPWDRPATVVTAGEEPPPPGRDGRVGESARGHPDAVLLSERAAAILQGFPETWTFCGRTKGSRWGQIGQAMPPALAEAVARAIAQREGA